MPGTVYSSHSAACPRLHHPFACQLLHASLCCCLRRLQLQGWPTLAWRCRPCMRSLLAACPAPWSSSILSLITSFCPFPQNPLAALTAFENCLRLRCLPVPVPLTLLPFCFFVLFGTPFRPLLPPALLFLLLRPLSICICQWQIFLWTVSSWHLHVSYSWFLFPVRNSVGISLVFGYFLPLFSIFSPSNR